MKRVIAAYCFKGKGKKHRVVVITSSTGRWIIPKGQVEDDLRNREVALEEAWEEAGIRGKLKGTMREFVVNRGGRALWKVFPVKIKTMADSWPEKKHRKRRLVRVEEALSLIDNADLRRALRKFAARYTDD